jgi:hypothetical protein
MNKHKCFLSLGIFWILLVISVGINVYFLTLCYWGKPIWSNCKIVVQRNEEEIVSSDEFLGKAVDFYQSLVHYQIAIVGVLLVVGFAYTYFISRKQAGEMIDEEIYSERLKEHFRPLIQELVSNSFNNHEVTEILGDVQEEINTLKDNFLEFQSPRNNDNNTVSSKLTLTPPPQKCKEHSNGNDKKRYNRNKNKKSRRRY